jgi:ribosomal protein S18 acetylase RimI-like enzyme
VPDPRKALKRDTKAISAINGDRRPVIGHPTVRTLVVDLDGEVIGVIQYAPTSEPGSAMLQCLHVREDHRGEGYGSALMTSAIDDLRKRGFTRATLLVDELNVRAIRLYERLGFTDDGAKQRAMMDRRLPSMHIVVLLHYSMNLSTPRMVRSTT